MESRDTYFDRVYGENASRLKQFIVVRIRSVSDMEDVYQEVWKRFYERTAVLRPNEPIRYLAAIAKGELAKRYHSAGQAEANDEAPLQRGNSGPLCRRLNTRCSNGWKRRKIWRIVKTEPLPSYQSFVALLWLRPAGKARSPNALHLQRGRGKSEALPNTENESDRNGKEKTSNEETGSKRMFRSGTRIV